jgi:hypothetical protein
MISRGRAPLSTWVIAAAPVFARFLFERASKQLDHRTARMMVEFVLSYRKVSWPVP